MSHMQPRARASSASLPQVEVPVFRRLKDGFTAASVVGVQWDSAVGQICVTKLFKMRPITTRMRNVATRIPRQNPNAIIFKRSVRLSRWELGIWESCCFGSSSCCPLRGSYFGRNAPIISTTSVKKAM
jgi:hypothetical protein